MERNYPSPLPVQKKLSQRHTMTELSHQIGFSEQDFSAAIKDSDTFVNMTHSDLSTLLTRIENNTFKRMKGNLSCADIMLKEVMSVEFGTEVEEAWGIMHQHHLKAMPVVDAANRVIGIITWNDFFKSLNLTAYDSFQDKFRQFIQRTPEMSASKPEAVGLIMTTSVTTLPEKTNTVRHD